MRRKDYGSVPPVLDEAADLVYCRPPISSATAKSPFRSPAAVASTFGARAKQAQVVAHNDDLEAAVARRLIWS